MAFLLKCGSKSVLERALSGFWLHYASVDLKPFCTRKIRDKKKKKKRSAQNSHVVNSWLDLTDTRNPDAQ